MSGEQRKKIFIVDDDQLYSSALGNLLNEKKMYRVFHFSSGESCLNEMYQSPEIVILDYYLNSIHPKAADGLEILEKIKKHHPHTKVIILSGQKHYGVAAQTIVKGASIYVMKDEDAFQVISDFLDELN